MLKISTDFARRHLNPDASTRAFNPTPIGWAIMLASGAAVLAIAATAFGSTRSTSTTKPTDLPGIVPDFECDPEPYDVDVDDLRAMIGTQINQGLLDKAVIATNVATMVFGAHPGGGFASFPPGASPLPGVMCVWSVVVFIVEDEFEQRGLGNIEVPTEPTKPTEPTEPTEPTGSLQWVTRGTLNDGYPWEEPVLHSTNTPSPGMFVDIGAQGAWDPSDGYNKMLRQYLGSALSMANLYVDGIANSPQYQEVRKRLREAITAVGGFNDLLYGQTNLVAAGGGANNTYVLNAQGRGLNWYPRHHNVKYAIGAGEAPERGTRLNGNKLSGANAGSQQMLVWLPALDIDALKNGVVDFLTWSDGSSTLDPPPQIRALGVDMHGVSLPGT